MIGRLAQAAKLSNARAITARAEDWARTPAALGGGGEAYDAVVARAVAALPVLVEYAAPLLREGGVLVAWKGVRVSDEEAAGAAAAAAVALAVEGGASGQAVEGARDRHLHVFRKIAPTPERFPRRAVAVKRPLG